MYDSLLILLETIFPQLLFFYYILLLANLAFFFNLKERMRLSQQGLRAVAETEGRNKENAKKDH